MIAQPAELLGANGFPAIQAAYISGLRKLLLESVRECVNSEWQHERAWHIQEQREIRAALRAAEELRMLLGATPVS